MLHSKDYFMNVELTLQSTQVPVPLLYGDRRRRRHRAGGVPNGRRGAVPNAGGQAGLRVRRVQHQVQESVSRVTQIGRTEVEANLGLVFFVIL